VGLFEVNEQSITTQSCPITITTVPLSKPYAELLFPSCAQILCNE